MPFVILNGQATFFHKNMTMEKQPWMKDASPIKKHKGHHK